MPSTIKGGSCDSRRSRPWSDQAVVRKKRLGARELDRPGSRPHRRLAGSVPDRIDRLLESRGGAGQAHRTPRKASQPEWLATRRSGIGFSALAAWPWTHRSTARNTCGLCGARQGAPSVEAGLSRSGSTHGRSRILESPCDCGSRVRLRRGVAASTRASRRRFVDVQSWEQRRASRRLP